MGRDARSVEAGTPFAVGSLTKTFMAALVLQLREEGRLWLGTPAFHAGCRTIRARRDITVKMLLDHRSGIFDYFAHPGYESRVFGRPRHRWTPAEILALRGPRYCEPGRLLPLLEHELRAAGPGRAQDHGPLSGGPHPQALPGAAGPERHVLPGTGAHRRRSLRGGYWAIGRRHVGFSDGTRFRPNTSGATVAESAGAMLSSVRDISDWQDALLSGDVLEPASLELMTTLHRSSGYGLGMRRAWLDGLPGLGHGGSLRGFVSVMYRLPEDDLDVVVLTNLGRTNLETLSDHLAHASLRYLEPVEPPLP